MKKRDVEEMDGCKYIEVNDEGLVIERGAGKRSTLEVGYDLTQLCAPLPTQHESDNLGPSPHTLLFSRFCRWTQSSSVQAKSALPHCSSPLRSRDKGSSS
jgi:hypothetical protein